MRRPVRGHVVAVVAVCAVVAGCSEPDEPAGLSAETSDGGGASGTPPASDEPTSGASSGASGESGEPTGSGEPAEPTEPNPSFTQPFVPGEPSVIELPEQLPIEVPDDATAAEKAVLEAAGEFMASWDAVLFGAGVERSRIRETATGEQLQRLLSYGRKSLTRARVTVGEPTEIDLIDVSVDGDTAEVDICITMTDWVEYNAGAAKELDEVERQLVTMVREDGDWLAANSEPQDDASCS